MRDVGFALDGLEGDRLAAFDQGTDRLLRHRLRLGLRLRGGRDAQNSPAFGPEGHHDRDDRRRTRAHVRRIGHREVPEERGAAISDATMP
ncbi:hypothetical protein ACIO6T_34635 [Streptomyces sp. NPDC087532]|uniref:hypothetical protein n=1 Tax=unclassified Streptomyces TaxID=2593676 RepID=UPI003329A7CC